MTTFTIDADNNITAHASATEAKALAGTERFGNEAALAKLAANWTAARLVEIYNSLTGVTPVKKFKDRNTGAARIWSNIQNLASEPDATATPAAQQAPAVAPAQAPAKNKATSPKKAPASVTSATTTLAPAIASGTFQGQIFTFYMANNSSSLSFTYPSNMKNGLFGASPGVGSYVQDFFWNGTNWIGKSETSF